MRPSTSLLLGICFCTICVIFLIREQNRAQAENQRIEHELSVIVGNLGVTDLCVATDARYLRHLSVTDSVAPFMDSPRALEYFPSSSAIVPVK